MAVTAEQLGAFNQAVARGDYAGAAAMAQAAGFSPNVVADYIAQNAAGLGLGQFNVQDPAQMAALRSQVSAAFDAAGGAAAGGAGGAGAGGAGAGANAAPLTGQALIDAAVRAATGGSAATRQSDIGNIITAVIQAGGTERDVAINLARANVGLSEISQLLGRPASELAGISGGAYQVGQERPISQMRPITPLTPGTGQSNIDPLIAPYLQEALERSRSLFLGAPPAFFPGQTYVEPSAQTQEALNQMEMIARGAAPYFEQAREAYGTSLRGLEQTAGGAFLGGSPYREQMIAAATRPLTQQFQEQILPGISSQYSAAGRYGSGAMERAQERATEGFTRAMGDVTSAITAQDYGRERAFQEAALRDIGTTALQVPEFYSGFLRPAQTMAAVGGQREAIAAQPLQESIQRFQFAQQQPYQQLGGYLSSIYGSPLASSGMVPEVSQNRGLQNVGTALSFLGGLPPAIQGAQQGWNFVSSLLS